MTGSKNGDGRTISSQNILYYNLIAPDYDAILNKDAANAMIRQTVASRFIALVKGGSVLDFGGGTGRDLGWLTQNRYRVIFCEPSAAMRQIAMGREKTEFPEAGVTFFDDNQSDFRNWDTLLPFQQKTDAVLANFAVFNCIPDIEFLFEKLALATDPGGIVITLMLDGGILKRLRSNLKGTIKSIFSGAPVSYRIDYNGERQLVYIHSIHAIKKAVKRKFEFCHFERLDGSGFCLIHLVRK
jgi:SAM-dependent methyltransferase